MPDELTNIKAYAFQGCTKLRRLLFHNTSKLRTIGKAAFSGTGLTSVALPGDVFSIAEDSDHAFSAGSVCSGFDVCDSICGGKDDKYGACTTSWCQLNSQVANLRIQSQYFVCNDEPEPKPLGPLCLGSLNGTYNCSDWVFVHNFDCSLKWRDECPGLAHPDQATFGENFTLGDGCPQECYPPSPSPSPEVTCDFEQMMTALADDVLWKHPGLIDECIALGHKIPQRGVHLQIQCKDKGNIMPCDIAEIINSHLDRLSIGSSDHPAKSEIKNVRNHLGYQYSEANWEACTKVAKADTVVCPAGKAGNNDDHEQPESFPWSGCVAEAINPERVPSGTPFPCVEDYRNQTEIDDEGRTCFDPHRDCCAGKGHKDHPGGGCIAGFEQLFGDVCYREHGEDVAWSVCCVPIQKSNTSDFSYKRLPENAATFAKEVGDHGSDRDEAEIFAFDNTKTPKFANGSSCSDQAIIKAFKDNDNECRQGVSRYGHCDDHPYLDSDNSAPSPPTYASEEAKCLERKDQGFSWEYRDDEWKCIDLKQDAKDKCESQGRHFQWDGNICIDLKKFCESQQKEWKCSYSTGGQQMCDCVERGCTDDPDGYLGNSTDCQSLLLHPKILGNCSTDMGVVNNAAAGYEVWMYCQKTCKACNQEVDWGARR